MLAWWQWKLGEKNTLWHVGWYLPLLTLKIWKKSKRHNLSICVLMMRLTFKKNKKLYVREQQELRLGRKLLKSPSTFSLEAQNPGNVFFKSGQKSPKRSSFFSHIQVFMYQRLVMRSGLKKFKKSQSTYKCYSTETLFWSHKQ